MKLSVFTLAAGIGLAASTSAFADDIKPATAVQPVAATDDSNRIVCHGVVHEGMLLHRTVCHTQKEWDRIRRETQAMLVDWQMRGLDFSQP